MLKTKIKIAHSPDSDDAFMFYALRSRKIDLGSFEFEFTHAEIETLNKACLEGSSEADLFAVSFHAYAYLREQYQMLRSGASMAGENYGPCVISNLTQLPNSIINIAVPGRYTSAYLAFQDWASEENIRFNPVFCSYDEVFGLLAKQQVQASLLIHESQLQYQDHGYHLINNLGAWWFQKYQGLKLPLGTNVIKKSFGDELIQELDLLLKNSILWGLANLEEVLDFSRKFANNKLDDSKAKQYIDMYVNESTIYLSDKDLESVEILLKLAESCYNDSFESIQ